MKKLQFTTVLLLLICVIAGNQLHAQKNADMLKTEIQGMNDKLIKAMHENDMEVYNKYYSENVIHMPNYGPVIKGRKMVMDKQKEEEKAGFKILSMDLKTDDVFPDKLYVIETGHYAITMTIPNMPEPMKDKGKYLTVWERQKDGSLKIFIETWNTDTNPMEMEMKKEAAGH
jgi:ketosteroid isomerase-like protein